MRRTPTAHRSTTMKRVPKIGDVMSRDFAVVSPETPLQRVAKMFLKKKSSLAAVIDDQKRFQGFLSTQGLMLALVDFLNEEVPVGPIGHYLDRELPVLREESSLLAAVDSFATGGGATFALPVLRGDRLVGVVTRQDVVRGAMNYFGSGKDIGPGTLYISALKSVDEKPPFHHDRDHEEKKQ